MLALDRRLERWVVHHRAGGLLDHAFVWLTQSARFGLIWLAIGIVLAVARRRPWLLAPLFAADLLADGIAGLLKGVFDRARPPVRYARPHALVAVPHDGSFPSGHAATSFACATVLTAFAPRLAPLWLVLAYAIAYSRVYVGAHYPLDAIGGAVLGVLVGAAVLLAARALPTRAGALRRSRRRPRRG